MKLITKNLLGILAIILVVFVNSSFQIQTNDTKIEYTTDSLCKYFKQYAQHLKNHTQLMSRKIELINKRREHLKNEILEKDQRFKELQIKYDNDTKQLKDTLNNKLKETNAEWSNKLKLSNSNLEECKSQVEQLQSQIDIKRKGDHNFCPSSGHSTGHIKTLQIALPCKTDTTDNVWTIVSRRKTFLENFNRSWAEYADGFGDNTTDFFIGLNLLHLITSKEPHELLIEMNVENKFLWARYSHFEIGNETEAFQLKSLGDYSGDAGDGLRRNVKQKFSTYDRDNDLFIDGSCAKDDGGGWWFTDCGLK